MTFSRSRRVVITGLGVVAPNGIGKEVFWEATCNGISGIKPISRFSTENIPISVAGTVDNLLTEDVVDRKLVHRTDRMTHFTFAAVAEALYDAGLELAGENPQRVGAVIANTMGGVEFVLEQIASLYMRGPRFMSAYTAIAWLQVANVGQISVRYGIQGYSKTPVNDLAGGLNALGMSSTAISRGAADVIIAGGSEALLHPTILTVLSHSNAFASGNDIRSYHPFDRRAHGLVLAEGAGICILEEYEHALQRGAPIYGEIIGYGQTSDAQPWNTSSVSSKHYARAITLALQEGKIASDDIGYYSLDGRATPSFDQAEAEALKMAFGTEYAHIPGSVPRTMTGHSYAAAGAIDTITALLALHHGIIPPTISCEELDPRYELEIVRDEVRPLLRPVVLLGSRGLGGANVVLALRRV